MQKSRSLLGIVAISIFGAMTLPPINTQEKIRITQDFPPSKTKIQNDMKEPISSKFVGRLISVESEWNPQAISPKGARGLMQVMPQVWEQYRGNRDTLEMHDPLLNKQVGVRHLIEIEKYCESRHPYWNSLEIEDKQDLLAAAYNGGPYRLWKRKWKIPSMPKETREFVREIRQRLSHSI